jgi:hypothetical protein
MDLAEADPSATAFREALGRAFEKEKSSRTEALEKEKPPREKPPR